MTNMNTISTIAIPQGAPLVLLSLPFCILLPWAMNWFSLHKHDHLILIPQTVHPFPSPKVSCSHPYHPHFYGCVMVSLNESKTPLFFRCRPCLSAMPILRLPPFFFLESNLPLPLEKPHFSISLKFSKTTERVPPEKIPPSLDVEMLFLFLCNACLPFSAWSQYRIPLLFVLPMYLSVHGDCVSPKISFCMEVSIYSSMGSNFFLFLVAVSSLYGGNFIK